jgi:hypothetical protein
MVSVSADDLDETVEARVNEGTWEFELAPPLLFDFGWEIAESNEVTFDAQSVITPFLWGCA